MPIRDWPKSERPRERLLARGPEALSDAELLAVIIGSGLKGRSALDVARELIAAFGSIRGLLQADSRESLQAQGLGPARFALLRAGVELARRHHLDVLQARPVVPSERPLREFLLAQLRDRPYEVFCCLHLDSRHRLITFEEMFRGTVDGAAVHPRELVRQAVAHNSTAVILVHNHPLCCVQGVTVEGKEGCGLAPKLQILSRRPDRQGAALLTSGTLRCSPEVAARACDGRAAA